VSRVAKGKPAARRGRKARGLIETAQLPTSKTTHMQDREVQLMTRYRLYRMATAAAAVITVVVASGAGNKF